MSFKLAIWVRTSETNTFQTVLYASKYFKVQDYGNKNTNEIKLYKEMNDNENNGM